MLSSKNRGGLSVSVYWWSGASVCSTSDYFFIVSGCRINRHMVVGYKMIKDMTS